MGHSLPPTYSILFFKLKCFQFPNLISYSSQATQFRSFVNLIATFLWICFDLLISLVECGIQKDCWSNMAQDAGTYF